VSCERSCASKTPGSFVSVRSGWSPAPPGGTDVGDLSPEALLAGDTVSGRSGNLVFAAVPVTLTPEERAQLKLGGGQIAIVLTRKWVTWDRAGATSSSPEGWRCSLPRSSPGNLSRRLSRPLVEAMEATARIAAGNLDSRVPQRPTTMPESASLARSINEMAQALKTGAAGNVISSCRSRTTCGRH
jgi:hypothetical protein